MTHSIRLTCTNYRSDIASVRKTISLNRLGPDLSVRLESGVPDRGLAAAVDVYLQRRDVYLIGFRNAHVGVKFKDTNPIIDGVDFNRTLPFSPNYSILGAWHEDLAIRNIWSFHSAISALADVRKDSTFGREGARGLILAIFVVSEALRFWTISKAVETVLCDRGDAGVFKYSDWKDKVNNWDRLSKGPQSGALEGVILPSI